MPPNPYLGGPQSKKRPKEDQNMRLIKFILLLLFGALLLLGILGGILDIAQLLSMNLSALYSAHYLIDRSCHLPPSR